MPAPLRDRIQQWEASPPPGAWNHIASAIAEDNAERQLSQRLQAMELPAPDPAWEKIAGSLGGSNTSSEQIKKTPVIPIRPLYPYMIRYASIAAAIAVLVWLFNENPFGGWKPDLSTAIVPVPVPKGKITTAETAAAPAKARSGSAVAVSAATANNSNNAGSSNDASNLRTEAPIAANEFSNPDKRRKMVHATLRYTSNGVGRQTIPIIQVANPSAMGMRSLPVQANDPRYIHVFNEQGIPVKLSAKFAPLYYRLIKELEADGVSGAGAMLKRLQEQVQQGAFIPDPENMFDMLRLRELLRENNK